VQEAHPFAVPMAGSAISSAALHHRAARSGVPPPRQGKSDRTGGSKTVSVVSFNSRGWNGGQQHEKLDLIINWMRVHNIDVCAVQEIWDKETETLTYKGFTVLRQCQGKNWRHSVGIIIAPRIVGEWKSAGCEVHRAERVIAIRWGSGREAGACVCGYAPTSKHSDATYDKFLGRVAKAVQWAKANTPNVTVCMDANAAIGRNPRDGEEGEASPARGPYNGARVNARGKTLLAWLEAQRLIATTTLFRPRGRGCVKRDERWRNERRRPGLRGFCKATKRARRRKRKRRESDRAAARRSRRARAEAGASGSMAVACMTWQHIKTASPFHLDDVFVPVEKRRDVLSARVVRDFNVGSDHWPVRAVMKAKFRKAAQAVKPVRFDTRKLRVDPETLAEFQAEASAASERGKQVDHWAEV